MPWRLIQCGEEPDMTLAHNEPRSVGRWKIGSYYRTSRWFWMPRTGEVMVCIPTGHYFLARNTDEPRNPPDSYLRGRIIHLVCFNPLNRNDLDDLLTLRLHVGRSPRFHGLELVTDGLTALALAASGLG